MHCAESDHAEEEDTEFGVDVETVWRKKPDWVDVVEDLTAERRRFLMNDVPHRI